MDAYAALQRNEGAGGAQGEVDPAFVEPAAEGTERLRAGHIRIRRRLELEHDVFRVRRPDALRPVSPASGPIANRFAGAA